MSKTTAIILAAGQGTRMRSTLPKVLHPIAGRPMVWHALQAACQAAPETPVLVVGHGAARVQQAVGDAVRYALQTRQLGTGHAVRQAAPLLQGQTDDVLVTSADMPLLTAATLQRMVTAHQAHTGPLTLLTVLSADPRGFGRIVRGPEGAVQAIVEEAGATPEQLALRELNVGAYCFTANWLWDALPQITVSPKGEYYLTDLVEIAGREGLSVQPFRLEHPEEAIGVNTRVHLAEAEAAMRARINRRWMLSGVTLVDPQTTFIEVEVEVEPDTTLWPHTVLRGATRIGRGCEVGPGAYLENAHLGAHCRVPAATLRGVALPDHTKIAPYTFLQASDPLPESPPPS